MYQVSYLWSGPELPEPGLALWEGDTDRLDRLRESGWDPEAPLRLSKYTTALPITIAISADNAASISWLLDHNVSLNDPDEAAFLTAVRIARPALARHLAAAGAKVGATHRVGGDAFQQTIFGDRPDVMVMLELIAELGHDPAKHGGASLRNAVSDGRLDIAQWFLDRGADIDFHQPNQVWEWGPSALGITARYGEVSTARWLVERGADVLLADRNGMRPYSVAVERGDEELSSYFRSLEPDDIHHRANALALLRRYKTPPELVEYLATDDRRIPLPESGFGWVEFLALEDVMEFKTGRTTVLKLSRATGDYDHVQLIWDKRAKRLCWWDLEHQERGTLGTWAEFMADPDRAMSSIL